MVSQFRKRVATHAQHRYKLVKLERTVGPYTAGNYWADPDLDHAAQLMRYVFEHQQEAKLVGQRARAYMLENYSMERAAAWMKQQMDEIQQNPVKRSQTVMDLAPSFLGFVSPHPRGSNTIVILSSGTVLTSSHSGEGRFVPAPDISTISRYRW